MAQEGDDCGCGGASATTPTPTTPAPTTPPPSPLAGGLPGMSPCDVEALKRCLAEHDGDQRRCQAEVDAFQRACGMAAKPGAGG